MEPEADWTIHRDEIVQFHQGLISRVETVTQIFIRFIDSDTGESSVREGGGVKDGLLLQRAVPKGGSPGPLPTRNADEAQALADRAAGALSRSVVRYTITLKLAQLLQHRSGERRPAHQIKKDDSVLLEHAPKPLYVAEFALDKDAKAIYLVLGNEDLMERVAVELELDRLEHDY